jgi:hypothetical protein
LVATTNSLGRFSLDSLSWPERGVALAATDVHADIVYSRKLQLFENHRKRGVGGQCLRPDLGNASEFWDLRNHAQQSPNTSVTLRQGYWLVTMRGRQGACLPSLWLDGSRYRQTFDDMMTMVRSGEMLGVEIDSRSLGLPSEYTEPRKDCGAIVVWTKPPPPTMARKPKLGVARGDSRWASPE